MLETIGMIIVAIIGLIGVIIQTQAKTKQKTIGRNNKEIFNLEKGKKINFCRSKTVELTKVRDELYKPNEEQKRLIIEAKRKYNDLGGDSYVDDMYDECKLKKLI